MEWDQKQNPQVARNSNAANSKKESEKKESEKRASEKRVSFTVEEQKEGPNVAE